MRDICVILRDAKGAFPKAAGRGSAVSTTSQRVVQAPHVESQDIFKTV